MLLCLLGLLALLLPLLSLLLLLLLLKLLPVAAAVTVAAAAKLHWRCGLPFWLQHVPLQFLAAATANVCRGS